MLTMSSGSVRMAAISSVISGCDEGDGDEQPVAQGGELVFEGVNVDAHPSGPGAEREPGEHPPGLGTSTVGQAGALILLAAAVACG